jgi:membrane-associated phospholipid phosphatase
MDTIALRYGEWARDRRVSLTSLLAIAAFLGSLFINFYAIQFATKHASNSVTDIILSNIPTFNVSWFFVYGLWLLVAFITLLCLHHPKRIPFTLFALALFVLIRAAFTSMTHIAPFELTYIPDFGESVRTTFFGADQFFSGHTGAPFLMALIYWHRSTLRYIFLAWSAFFAVIVLLGHLHYTIDVFAAFFITYGIFHITQWFFPKEYELLRKQG